MLLFPPLIFGGLLPLGESQEPPAQIAAPEPADGPLMSIFYHLTSISGHLMARPGGAGGAGSSSRFSWLAEVSELAQCWAPSSAGSSSSLVGIFLEAGNSRCLPAGAVDPLWSERS